MVEKCVNPFSMHEVHYVTVMYIILTPEFRIRVTSVNKIGLVHNSKKNRGAQALRALYPSHEFRRGGTGQSA